MPPASEIEEARERSRREQGLLAGVIDAHTHLFPERILRAVRDWFDAHSWSPLFRGHAEEGLEELARAGAKTMVALTYAHKPGVAEYLNSFMAEAAKAHASIVAVGSVFPGESGAREIVRDAIEKKKLRGIKLHCHVQRMAIDDPRVLDVLEECQLLGVPAIVHAGREPRSEAYGVETHDICDAARTETVLRRLPKLQLVVPHLGLDEIDAYLALVDQHENLYLDTAMSTSVPFDWREVEKRADRICFGTDFPIIPYETDRELKVLAQHIESDEAFERIVRGTAHKLWL